MKKFLMNSFLFLGLALVTTACSSMKKCCVGGEKSACCAEGKQGKEGCKDGKCDAKKIAPAVEAATAVEAAPVSTSTPAAPVKTKTKKKSK